MAAKANLRTGAKQAGTFPKGKSGNPGGRPKKTPELIEVENLCKEASPKAVARLIEWIDSDNAKASVSASMGILERGFGKPRQPIEHSGTLSIASVLEAARERVKHARN